MAKKQKKSFVKYALYSSDPKLKALKKKAREACWKYNNTRPDKLKKKKGILKKILGGFGKNLKINAPIFLQYGKNLFLGNDFYANSGCVFLDAANITIGDNCMLGPGVHIYTASHFTSPEQRRKGRSLMYAKPVTIKDNVWIGGGVIILPGVTIGKDSVIGAGSVVTVDIPSCVLAFGNPCRVIRPLDDDEPETAS